MKKILIIIMSLYSLICYSQQLGNKIDKKLYINDRIIETNIFKNLNETITTPENNLSCFVDIEIIFKELGYEVTINKNEVNLVNKIENKSIKIVDNLVIIYSNKDFSGNEKRSIIRKSETAIENNHIYISLSKIRFIVNGNETENRDGIYLYTENYERIDIPDTLEKCYSSLDEIISADERKEISETSIKNSAKYHLSLGLWIRNEWIKQSPNKRIAKLFIDNGIKNPEEISDLIIKGYIDHLNNKDTGIEEIVKLK